MMRFAMLWLVVRANQRGEHRGQEHEHEGLDQPNEYFQKIKWNGQQHAKHSFGPGRMLNGVRHRFEQIFSRENVSVKTEAERNRTKRYRDQLEKANREENHDHH